MILAPRGRAGCVGTLLALRMLSEAVLNRTEGPPPLGRRVRQRRKVHRARRISGAGKRQRRD